VTAATEAPQSGADILARIQPRLREDWIEVCLRPDLIDEWAQENEALLESQAKDEEKATPKGRLVNPSAVDVPTSAETKRIAKRVLALEGQIVEASIKLWFRAMPKDRWQALTDDHPPRKGNEFDTFAGYNRDAVVDAAVRMCLFDPVFDDESFDQLIAVLNPSEWAEIRRKVNEVNGRVGGSPKSALASRVLTKRASTSAPPATGE
jgi:hypothetical protein